MEEMLVVTFTVEFDLLYLSLKLTCVEIASINVILLLKA